jgi:hypothetical protein
VKRVSPVDGSAVGAPVVLLKDGANATVGAVAAGNAVGGTIAGEGDGDGDVCIEFDDVGATVT